MDKEKASRIIHEHLVNGISFRNLALRYGISHTHAYRILKSHRSADNQKPLQEELPDDVKQLQAMLRKERLKNELLNNIIDIADKELGTNIRKKSGTRRSE